MVGLKLNRTDLPRNHQKPVQDAISLLYQRDVKGGNQNQAKSRSQRWTVFARCLQRSLDESFGPAWHVLVGTSVGYACKKRNATMGVWQVDDGVVVIWKSPGIEEPLQRDGGNPNDDPVLEVDTKPRDGSTGEVDSRSWKVLEPSDIEVGSDVERVVSVLRTIAIRSLAADLDSQKLAQVVRRSLTKELGPIWHVVAGQEFAIAPAGDSRNLVIVNIGKLKIACFQHEQFLATRLVDRIDFNRLLAALPYLSVIVFFFIYITVHAICQDKTDRSRRFASAWLQSRICSATWEHDLCTVAACVTGVLFFAKRFRGRKGKLA